MKDTSSLPEILWGARQIGEAIGRSSRQANYMLVTGAIPAKKVSGSWCANRDELLAFFKTLTKEGAAE